MSGGILTLDLATGISGWAYADPGGAPEWGEKTFKFDGETFRDNGGKIGSRFSVFLESRIDVFKPLYIVRELVYIGGGTKQMNPETINALCALAGLTDTITYQRTGRECLREQTAAFIKAFTGRGRYPNTGAKKRATVATCKLHGWNVTGHNAADALALLWYSETVLFPQMRLSMKRSAGPLFSLDKSVTTSST